MLHGRVTRIAVPAFEGVRAPRGARHVHANASHGSLQDTIGTFPCRDALPMDDAGSGGKLGANH